MRNFHFGSQRCFRYILNLILTNFKEKFLFLHLMNEWIIQSFRDISNSRWTYWINFFFGFTAHNRCLKNYLKGVFANNKRGYRLTPNWIRFPSVANTSFSDGNLEISTLIVPGRGGSCTVICVDTVFLLKIFNNISSFSFYLVIRNS